MPKVSVVVPVYGVEKYIERCAHSLFEQTLDDIEFIFVDDCTPDRSIEILTSVLEEYPKRKKQTKIIHHDENKGLPIARQTGINAATGDYIAHCDSDDWVDIDLFECLYKQALLEQLDVVIYNYRTTDVLHILSEHSGGTNTDRNTCINEMMHRNMWWSLCNKMFKHELYIHEDLVFPKDAMGEDMCLTLQLFYYCHRIGYVDKYYYYFTNPTSIIQQVSEDKCLSKFHQIIRNVEIVKSFYTSKNCARKFRRGLNYLEYNSKCTLLPLLREREYKKLWCNVYKGCEWKIICDNDSALRERLKAILIRLGLYPRNRKKRII